MTRHPLFLTVVYIVRNEAARLPHLLREATEQISALATDYELVVIDNASDDDSVAVLRELTGADGLPNLQVYALTREVEADAAAWAGVENALGDFVAVLDPMVDDLSFLPEMMARAVGGADVVFARNRERPPQSVPYSVSYAVFNRLYKSLSGLDLSREAPQYRVISKRVVNFILQHNQPAAAYGHLPATGGFARVNLDYACTPHGGPKKRLKESIDRGMRLIVSTTRAPMRLVTTLSMFGALANLVYSLYVVAVALFKEDVAPGWTSLSLQQSGMFFLISLVLLVLGEYILNMASLSNEGPPYHVGQEFTSERLDRLAKLNVIDSVGARSSASRLSTTPAAADEPLHHA